MKLVVATHPSFRDHDTGDRHPERPERVDAVMRGLRSSGRDLVTIEAPSVDRTDLLRVHSEEYVEVLEGYCRTGGGRLDVDTFVSPGSWQAALHAAGAVIYLTEELRSRPDATGFAVTRPPGHHALRARAMGFCLFNNVAIAAAMLTARGERVAIVDWDVHHGNGTQALLGDDPGALYISIHQSPLYPDEGWPGDVDLMAPGTNVNIALPPGSGGDTYEAAFDEVVVPVIERFGPDWVLVSAGYDAHFDDPLADMELVATDYGRMARKLAATNPANRIVFALEGGYSLVALEESAETTVRGVAGEDLGGDPRPSVAGSRPALDAALAAARRHWAI